MNRQPFVYVTEIATTPEKLWAALTGNRFWRQFSGPVESAWEVGSPVTFFLPDGTVYSKGVVLESDPPHLLSHTWPDPEGEQTTARTQRLTWRIERGESQKVKLTLIHENLTEKAHQGVSSGWPKIFEGLKNLLETGMAPPIRA